MMLWTEWITALKREFAHEDQLFVTGGSAGGIMSAWMIGKNNRFEAAVVAKPVMNWISKTLVADNYFYLCRTQIPWSTLGNFEGYWKFSPISLVGTFNAHNGDGRDERFKDPSSEAKQLYHALKLRKLKRFWLKSQGQVMA